MNANDLISADLLPRNVPKPSSFHENTLKPEVPEVSLMFDNGFQYNKSNDNRQSMIDKAVRSSMKLSEGLQDRRCGSPIISEAVQELLQKNNSKQLPNKQKSKPSTPNKNKQVEMPNSLKSSSDEFDMERQNGVDNNNRHINAENHLIEPVESYSVWKYKNQHMFNKEQVNKKDIENHSESGQNDDDHREIRTSNRNIYKTNYEQQQAGLRYQNLPYEQDHLQYPRADPMKYVQDNLYTTDLVRNKNDQHRIGEEYVETRRPTGKPIWRNASPMSQEPVHSAIRYNEPVPCQTRRPEGNNSANELCKIVEFQTKHIEFLNEQIYNLTLQNKSFSNVKQQLKTLEDTQTETMDFMKRNFDKINDALQSIGTIGSVNKENKPLNSNKSSPCKKSDSTDSEKAENTLEKMEKKLIDLINSKLNSKPLPEPKFRNTNENYVEEHEGDTSSSEDTPVNKQDKQCACACDKKQVQVTNKIKQKELGVRKSQKHTNENDNRVHTKYPGGYQTDLMKYNAQEIKHWESPPGPSKQVANSKPAKKSQRKSNHMEQMVNPQPMPKVGPGQPVLYYQQPVYQQEKVVQNNRRMSNEGKQKKDKIKNSPDEKYGTRGRKGKSKGPAHYSKNNGGAPAFRLESNLMNDENSLTLNARELPVINEHIPSPEASVHIDMGEYQSSDNESDQDSDQEYQTGNREMSEESNDEPEDEAVPWPTFYNNVVGKVHKLLQGGHQQAPVEQVNDIPDDQYRTVQVRMATIDQFKKMGISFVDDSPNSKRVTFNSKNKTQKPVDPSYYENYRPNDGSSKRAPLTAVCNTNLSFASLQYLQRYHLLPNVQTQDLFHANNEMNHED